MSKMLSVKEAESLILNLKKPNTETESVDLSLCLGRILAQDIRSELDFPYWDNSAMDGYALLFDDVSKCSPQQPVTLEIVEEIPASVVPKKTLKPGQAARIFTGAMLPQGADTVIIQENTQKVGEKVEIFLPPARKGAFIRKKGEFYQGGDPLLSEGLILGPADIAILATAGKVKVPVYRKVRVAIFSTGDELVTPGENLQPGQIIDSNQSAIFAFVAACGATGITLPIVRDHPELLKKTIQQAISTADIVLSTGGVSVGDYDYVERILTELGAKIHISSVAIKPGKPLTVASFPNSSIYFGLPGNPVSALVCCWRFVQPTLKKLSGFKGNCEPEWVRARSLQKLRSDGKRETYFWGNLINVNGYYQFTLAQGSQNSANLINLAQTNGLGVLKVGQTDTSEQEEVMVMRLP